MHIGDIINKFTGIILTGIIPLLTGLGLFYFLYGLYMFMSASGNETKRSDGKFYIIYGLIGLFVMISVWGLVSIVSSTFFNTSDITIPLIGVGIPAVGVGF